MGGALLGVAATAGRYLRPRRTYNVLHVELNGDTPESEGGWSLRDLGRRHRPPDLVTLLATLRAAREDPDLGLVLVDIHAATAGWSRLQSARRALLALRAAGKRVWAYLSHPGMHEYYLATAAERVWLAPAAVFDVTGLASEVIFFKGTLDRLGIEAQFARVGRFKSAAESFTRTGMSPEHRSMVDGLLDDLYAQLVADIAAARNLDEEGVRAAFADGPLLARDALARGFVDAVGYPDQVTQALEDRFGDSATIDLARYRRRRALAIRRASLGAPVVGLLSVSGALGLADAVATPANAVASWRVFRRELAALAHDRRLGAIVIRVDSPGGSGLAADLMWREIAQARRLKPVLVSMGDVAASGGYYLAAGADHVTAEPGTLTGSIGVLAGKPVLRGMYDHLGVTKELVVRGNAARHSDYVRLSEGDLARLQTEAQAFYGDFVAKVAAGRGLAPEAVESVAEGRVWTGRQARTHGLIDCLGGLEQAFDEVRRRLGVAPGTPVAVARRPRTLPLWRALFGVRPLAGDLVGELDVLAPILAGERVLATMPFLLRFLPGGRGGGPSGMETLAAATLAAASVGAVRPRATGVVHAVRVLASGLAGMVRAVRRPRLVL